MRRKRSNAARTIWLSGSTCRAGFTTTEGSNGMEPHRAGLTYAGMRRKVRECGPRGQHNELAGSARPKRASTSCDTPEWYYKNGRQRQPPDLPHIGGQKSVSRDHSADWPTAKASVCGSAADLRPKSDKGLDFPGTQSVHTQGLPRPKLNPGSPQPSPAWSAGPVAVTAPAGVGTPEGGSDHDGITKGSHDQKVGKTAA
jgi:hypothetical protein